MGIILWCSNWQKCSQATPEAIVSRGVNVSPFCSVSDRMIMEIESPWIEKYRMFVSFRALDVVNYDTLQCAGQTSQILQEIKTQNDKKEVFTTYKWVYLSRRVTTWWVRASGFPRVGRRRDLWTATDGMTGSWLLNIHFFIPEGTPILRNYNKIQTLSDMTKYITVTVTGWNICEKYRNRSGPTCDICKWKPWKLQFWPVDIDHQTWPRFLSCSMSCQISWLYVKHWMRVMDTCLHISKVHLLCGKC